MMWRPIGISASRTRSFFSFGGSLEPRRYTRLTIPHDSRIAADGVGPSFGEGPFESLRPPASADLPGAAFEVLHAVGLIRRKCGRIDKRIDTTAANPTCDLVTIVIRLLPRRICAPRSLSVVTITADT